MPPIAKATAYSPRPAGPKALASATLVTNDKVPKTICVMYVPATLRQKSALMPRVASFEAREPRVEPSQFLAGISRTVTRDSLTSVGIHSWRPSRACLLDSGLPSGTTRHECNGENTQRSSGPISLQSVCCLVSKLVTKRKGRALAAEASSAFILDVRATAFRR